MKISNETKIGALTAISVTLLILGFNFLKGKSLFKTGNFLNVKYTDTKGLQPSNQVLVNGYQVGAVYEIEPLDVNLHQINVTIRLNNKFNIPDNSVAFINSNPLGSPSIEIKLGSSTNFLKSEDTLMSVNSGGLLDSLSSRLQPVADSLKFTLHTLNDVLKNFNSVLDTSTRGNLKSSISNLNGITNDFKASAASLKKMMNPENGSITQTFDSFKIFAKHLAVNSDKLDTIFTNLKTASGKFSGSDVDSVIQNLKTSMANFKMATQKINSSNGSLGALINDRALYDSLQNTIMSLHILMDDLRVHPKRYVNISVFGKKDKGDYLTSPLQTDSTSNIK